MPRRRTASAKLRPILAAKIAPRRTIVQRIELLAALNDRRQKANGDADELRQIAQAYRELKAFQTATEIEKGL